MNPFDIRHFLNDPELSVEIMIDSVPARAIIKHYDLTKSNIRNVNNQSFFYPIEIEICSIRENENGKIVPVEIVEGKTNGTVITIKDHKGNTTNLRVSKIIKKDDLANSYKLGLA